VDELFEAEIQKREARVHELALKYNELRRKYEADQVQMARLSHLIEEEERLERDIAAMEGRPYDGDEEQCYREPPDPPDMPGV
jgi:hypothetical protein